MAISGILFDMDGLLVDTEPLWLVAEEATMRSLGATWTQADQLAILGGPLEHAAHYMVGRSGTELSAHEVGQRLIRRMLELLRTEPITLQPGAAELVGRVAASPSAVPALLTGNVARGARIKLSAAGLWDRFRFGVFGDEASRRVDLGPIALARALETTGRPYTPEETVVVGDARADVECGRAIGARVVAVATGRTSAAELRAAGADAVFDSFADVPSALEAILD